MKKGSVFLGGFSNTSVKVYPRIHNFGFIPTGEPVSQVFYVKNIGRRKLKIVNIEKECSCITNVLSKDIAAPGDKIKIRINYTPYEDGVFQKNISVKMNIPNHYVTVIIKGKAYDSK